MKPDAIAIANYFVERAKENKSEITLLSLVKLVYIAHGFLLALTDRNFLNHRFDRVEAWKYCPVIPSVYYSFRHNQDRPISDCESILRVDDDRVCRFVIPKIEDKEALPVLEYVWSSYGDRSAAELVAITHKPNTPWRHFYIEGKNVEIPDSATKFYYTKLAEELQ